jgi:hypothetical protein
MHVFKNLIGARKKFRFLKIEEVLHDSTMYAGNYRYFPSLFILPVRVHQELNIPAPPTLQVGTGTGDFVYRYRYF